VAAAYLFAVDGGVIIGTNIAEVVAVAGPRYYIALWAERDSLATGYWPAYHYGLWVFLVPLFLGPHYALKSRGRQGVWLAAALISVVLLPDLGGYLGWYFYEDLPDFR